VKFFRIDHAGRPCRSNIKIGAHIVREAVFVSYARTGLAKSGRGGFNMTPAMTMAAHAIKHAVAKSGVEPADVEDVYLGNGAHGAGNLGRLAGLLGGLPVTTGGSTIQRHCSSGLNSIAMAANYIRNDGADVVVAGGVESISIPSPGFGGAVNMDPALPEQYPAIYMAMIETADIVAERYNVTREYQDEFSYESQMRTARAQENGLYENEIVPMETKMKLVDRETKEETIVDYTVDRDECNRPQTTLEALAKLGPVRGEGNYVTAGNASQLSDGAAAVVMMSDEEASRRGAQPMGAFRGWAVAGCEPDEMGIGPVYAVPRLLERHGLTVDDIDIWELNEAFASQCLYSRDTLGIDPEKYNVNGGSISIGHPFGMTGTRCAGHILQEGKRRGAKYGVVTLCIGGGQGAAGLIEIY
jgi:acetyl-CoA C-acetyltransferase